MEGNKNDITKCSVECGGAKVTIEVDAMAGVTVDELLDLLKQAVVGCGYCDYGNLYFSKMEEEEQSDV